MKFTINGVQHEIDLEPTTGCIVSYECICEWAGFNPTRTLSVTWSTEDKQGSLTPGTLALFIEEMSFTVVNTQNA